MDIQTVKDQLNQIEGYKGALLWLLQQFEKEIAAQAAPKQNEEKP